MMSYVDVPLDRLGLAAMLVVVAIVLSWVARLSLEKDLAFGAIRAAAQLVAIGYALHLLFKSTHPLTVFAALVVMWLSAAWTSTRRLKHGPRPSVLFPYAFAAIGVGGAVALVPVFAFVVRPSPWFDPRYLVPLSGMMLSSAMNVVAQVFERLFSTALADEATIEQRLALGATPQQALAPYATAALRAALIPTINGLLTVGLVALPGMMTGQIVAGVSPEQAVRYQLVVMYQLVAVAAVAGSLAVLFSRKLLFTPAAQLDLGWIKKDPVAK